MTNNHLGEEQLTSNVIDGQIVISNPVTKNQAEITKLIVSSVMLVIASLIMLNYIIELIVLIIQREPGDYGFFPYFFLLFFIGSWLLAFLSIAFSYAWEFKGIEIIIISDDKLIRNLSPAPLFNKSREFDLSLIEEIKTRNQKSGFLMNTRRLRSWGYGFGRIKGNIWFNYDGFPVTVGADLSDNDVSKIIRLIKDRITNLK